MEKKRVANFWVFLGAIVAIQTLWFGADQYFLVKGIFCAVMYYGENILYKLENKNG